jgi:hypothetical protein
MASYQTKEDENMQSLIPLILIGVFVYFIFSRKGGMGCCGGHGGHEEHQRHQNEHSEKSSDIRFENAIDLREDEYTITSSKTISSPETRKRDAS